MQVFLNCGVNDKKIAVYKRFVLDVLLDSVRREKYPRCTLAVSLRCLHDDGGVLASLVNVAIAAVLHAGIELQGSVPIGSAFAWAPPPAHAAANDAMGVAEGAEDALVVDPNSEDERRASANITVVACSTGERYLSTPLAEEARSKAIS